MLTKVPSLTKASDAIARIHVKGRPLLGADHWRDLYEIAARDQRGLLDEGVLHDRRDYSAWRVRLWQCSLPR
jgi:hypothetical protein